MLSKHLKGLIFLMLLLLGVLSASFWNGTSVTNAQEATSNKEDQATKFWNQSHDLALMSELFKGGKVKANEEGQPVTFDAETARKQGFSAESIQLAEQLAAFTNDLVAATEEAQKSVDATELEVDLQSYAALSEYFDLANSEAKNSDKMLDKMPNTRSWWNEYYCGAWWRPLPSSGGAWQTHTSSNPQQTLMSWGYHPTPDFAGGGWTRPQTHMWWLCGWSTYRDHAYITGNTIHEQNYAGWTPRGEPNPEVWLGGPWPYSHWPAYVYWWHRTY